MTDDKKDVDDLIKAIYAIEKCPSRPIYHDLNRFIADAAAAANRIIARQATEMRERNMPFEKLHNEPKPVFTPDFSGEPSLKTTYGMTRERDK